MRLSPHIHCNVTRITTWRGSLLPLGCAAVAKTAKPMRLTNFGRASRRSGSKLPRHKKRGFHQPRG
ncbi:hypothetical protein F7R05_02395 [Pseudomonas koreensis]|nr:hypothetical protein F7R05_02395 [Pseudomonas koreensis]